MILKAQKTIEGCSGLSTTARKMRKWLQRIAQWQCSQARHGKTNFEFE